MPWLKAIEMSQVWNMRCAENSQNLGMTCKIGNIGNEFNLSAIKLKQTNIYWKRSFYTKMCVGTKYERFTEQYIVNF